MKKEKIFFPTKIKISSGDKSIFLHAMVSPYGAARVIRADTVTSDILFFLGKEVDVQIKANLTVKGGFMLEKTKDGSFFNIFFTKITEEEREILRKDVETKGESVSWARKYPRINVASKVEGAPEPFLSIVNSEAGVLLMTVRDYTLAGVSLQYDGDHLPDFQVGDLLFFDILTTESDNIRAIQGIVLRLTEKKLDKKGIAKSLFIGVEIVKMSKNTDILYKDLIKKYCVALKQEMSKKAKEKE